jgi:hypothetical protein
MRGGYLNRGARTVCIEQRSVHKRHASHRNEWEVTHTHKNPLSVCVLLLFVFYHSLVEVLVKLFVQQNPQWSPLAHAFTYITVCFDCYLQ